MVARLAALVAVRAVTRRVAAAAVSALAARLAARGRITDGPLGPRLARSAPGQGDLAPDVVIENVGDLQSGGAQLIAAISSQPPMR